MIYQFIIFTLSFKHKLSIWKKRLLFDDLPVKYEFNVVKRYLDYHFHVIWCQRDQLLVWSLDNTNCCHTHWRSPKKTKHKRKCVINIWLYTLLTKIKINNKKELEKCKFLQSMKNVQMVRLVITVWIKWPIWRNYNLY